MNDIIIKILLIVIASTISLFARKYFEPMMPEKKKAISYIRNFLFFNLRYSLSVFILIYVLINFEFDKIFVFIFCWFFGVIIFNISVDFASYSRNKTEQLLMKAIKTLAEEIDKLKPEKKKTIKHKN